MVKRELSLWVYQSIYAPTLSCGHELCSDQKNEITDTSSRPLLRWFRYLIRIAREHVPGVDPDLAGGITYPIWPGIIQEELGNVAGGEGCLQYSAT